MPSPHHQDQINALPVAQQSDQASEQIQHLPLQQFCQATPKAGVADAASAEFMAASQQRHVGFAVGAAESCQGEGLHAVALLLEALG